MNVSWSYKLFTLYGPLAIHSYGFFIALGIIISSSLIKRDKRFIALNINDKINDIVVISIIAGVFGGRAIEIVSESQSYQHWTDWFALWNGGFSALGSILGVTTLVPLYLRYINISIAPLFDVAALYAPLFQSIARIGCLVAGCCHGIETSNIFSITYTNPMTIAQLGIAVHPTQLYSSILLFFIFLFMIGPAQYLLKKPGQLFFIYIMLASLERFTIDFWRADRILFYDSWISYYQLIALAIFFSGLMGFIWTSRTKILH